MNRRREVKVKILTESLGILEPPLTGVDECLQAIEVEMSEGGAVSGRLVIVHAYYPKLSESGCEKVALNLRRRYQNGNLYFVIEDQPGESGIYVPADQTRVNHFHVAAAVAVIKASWGWEEINPMIMKFADACIGVYLSRGDEGWIVSSRIRLHQPGGET